MLKSVKIKLQSFTLLETIIAIAIFVIIMTGTSLAIIAAYRSYGYNFAQANAIDEARRGVELMVKEIREAKPGDDGSFPIAKAEDKEFIFYSDIDQDEQTERVRYFLGTVSNGTQTKDCYTLSTGGACSAAFTNFFQGTLKKAEARVSVEGDFGWANREYVDLYADGAYLGRLCATGCSDCAGSWEGTRTFDVLSKAGDNSIQLTADASSDVNNSCNWQQSRHAMKAQFELSWEAEVTSEASYFKKGIIDPTSNPIQYPADQEKVNVITAYVRNSPPIFEYYDGQGNKITDYPARLKDTKMMRLYLAVDIDQNKNPPPFELESSVSLRNLKTE